MSTNQQGDTPDILVAIDYSLEPELEGLSPEEVLAGEREVQVRLADGSVVRLDPDDDRSPGFLRVITNLIEESRPIAFELGRDERIARTFVPHVSPVLGVTSLARGVVSIDLAASHGRHTLRDTHPRYPEFAELLEEAVRAGTVVILTEDDDHEVLDIRVSDAPPGPAVVKPAEPRNFVAKIWDWLIQWINCSCSFPWGWMRSISPAAAQALFNDLKALTCTPLAPTAPCITFNYPDDGCWGRAHEMCRIMVEGGRKPCKVWIQGALNVSTNNNPNCEVFWGWHVAPTLCVRGSGWFGIFTARSMVFDPALFDTPISKQQWKTVQGDSGATLTTSSWRIFHLWGSGSGTSWSSKTDPAFTQTNSVLAHYRTALLNRSIQFGPPPYLCT